MGYKLVSESDENNVLDLESNTVIDAYGEALATLGYKIISKQSTNKDLNPCWVDICMDTEDNRDTGYKVEVDISSYLPLIDVETLIGVALYDHFGGGEWTDSLARLLGSEDKEVAEFIDLVAKANRFGNKAVGFSLRVNSQKELVYYLLTDKLDLLEDEEFQELKRIQS